MAGSTQQRIAVVATLGLAALMTGTGVTTAQAATFTATGVAPAVTLQSTSAPFDPHSVESVTATVTDEDTLKDVDQVQLALHRGNSAGEVTPYDSFTVTFTRVGESFAAPAFAAAGNSQFTDQGSLAPTDLHGTTGEFTFTFSTPDIMRQGSDWVAAVTAADRMDHSATDMAKGLPVSSYQTVSLADSTVSGDAAGLVHTAVTVVSNHPGQLHFGPAPTDEATAEETLTAACTAENGQNLNQPGSTTAVQAFPAGTAPEGQLVAAECALPQDTGLVVGIV